MSLEDNPITHRQRANNAVLMYTEKRIQGLSHSVLCIYLNRLLGNPDFLQIKTFAFPT